MALAKRVKKKSKFLCMPHMGYDFAKIAMIYA
jgi:hypothetical protein